MSNFIQNDQQDDKQEQGQDSLFMRRYAVYAFIVIGIIVLFFTYITNQLKTFTDEAAAELTMQIVVVGSLIFAVLTAVVVGFYISLRKMLNTLEKARLEAELSSKAKSNFLANMSHEIRTPMNAILGLAEIEMQKESLTPDTEKSLEKIHEAGDLLLNIINDILDLSKIEAGRMEIRAVKYDIPGLIGDAVQLNRLRYESKPITFQLEIDENVPVKLYGDVLRIKQILNNILSNAFKYTNKGTVKLTVTVEKLATPPKGLGGVILVFKVSDTGKGMTPEQLSELFTEYTRFNVDANSTTVGTGLGLSITKRLLTLMGGDIQVESEPNAGSTFTVRLIQEKVDRTVCGPALAKQLNNLHFQSKTKSKRARFLREYMPYGNVLIVDDVESNIFVTKGILERYGLQIETVTSGFEAIKKIEKGIVYDIIFMDYMMPEMDGIETTRHIRKRGYKGYIVALTANALVGQAETFLENGFDGFLAKPIDLRELNQILNDFIRDKKPPEVVKAARRERHRRISAATDNTGKAKSTLNELFLQDAGGAIQVLEKLCAKQYDLNKEEMTSFEIAVHGMKSALLHIGEKELSDMAYELEKACRAKKLALMMEEAPSFIENLRNLVESISYTGSSEENTGAESETENADA